MKEQKQEDPEAWREEYRKKQASGIKFEICAKNDGVWEEVYCSFNLSKDMYREVKEEPKLEPLIHHPKERMLWLQQRIAGTNEQWRCESDEGEIIDLPIDQEPTWCKKYRYYPKPQTVKFYFCVIRHKSGSIGSYGQHGSKEELKSTVALGSATIIGNIEERDVDV